MVPKSNTDKNHFLRRAKFLINTLLGQDLYYRDQIKCEKRQYGSNYGGWVVCPAGIGKESIVYSFGVGEDISFDLALIQNFGVNVYAFDPTPKSVEWVKQQNLPEKFKLFEFGIADYDGIARFSPPENPTHISHTILDRPKTRHKAIYLPVHRLNTILNRLRHDKINILKMDVEGAEYTVIPDIIKSGIEIQQLLVEFHHRLPTVSVSNTKEMVKLLNNNGWRIFNVSSNGKNYSFIRS